MRLGHVTVESSDRLVERVPFDRLLPRPADQRHDLVVRQPHRRRRAGLVVDALENHRALQVVTAKGQRDLGDERRHHGPMRLDVRDVVEQQPSHRDVLEVVEAGRRRPGAAQRLAQLVVIGVIGERDVGQEAAGFVLERAQRQQVIDAICERLDVAVQHRAVRWHAELVRLAMYREPLLTGELAVGDGRACRG